MKTLAELRKDKGITQKQLHKEIGIPVSTIAMYETGERIPSLQRAKILADYFNVTLDDIFFEGIAHTMRAKSKLA